MADPAHSGCSVGVCLVYSALCLLIGISILGTRVNSDVKDYDALLPTSCSELRYLYAEEYNASACKIDRESVAQSTTSPVIMDTTCCDDLDYSCYPMEHYGCELHWYFCAQVNLNFSYFTWQGVAYNGSLSETFDSYALATE